MELDCGARINLLSHKVKARLDATFQSLGITGVQSRVIYYILNHCQENPVFQRDIENVFGLSRSTATGILQLLEKNGIIRRESVASDARLKSLVPTQRAVDLDSQVAASLKETERMLTRGLSEEQVRQFKDMTAQMLRNLDDWNAAACACSNAPPGRTSDGSAQKASEKSKEPQGKSRSGPAV